jgi:hypothetical protein
MYERGGGCSEVSFMVHMVLSVFWGSCSHRALINTSKPARSSGRCPFSECCRGRDNIDPLVRLRYSQYWGRISFARELTVKGKQECAKRCTGKPQFVICHWMTPARPGYDEDPRITSRLGPLPQGKPGLLEPHRAGRDARNVPGPLRPQAEPGAGTEPVGSDSAGLFSPGERVVRPGDPIGPADFSGPRRSVCPTCSRSFREIPQRRHVRVTFLNRSSSSNKALR